MDDFRRDSSRNSRTEQPPPSPDAAANGLSSGASDPCNSVAPIDEPLSAGSSHGSPAASAPNAAMNGAQSSTAPSPAALSETARLPIKRPQVNRPAALRHRNFRLFWSGNLVSLIGTMAQQTAQGWLVRTLTPDPLLITIVAGCGSAPILLLTLYAGVVADRVDKRRALMVTNATSALLALALAALVFFDVVAVWHIALISVGVGVVNAFDIPVRQAFNVDMVGREDLPSAIALNSSAFNGARVAGPAVGGWLLQSLGLAGCFVVNALSYGALLFGLFAMRLRAAPVPGVIAGAGEEHELPPRPAARFADVVADMKAGYRFVREHEVLWAVTLLVAFVSLLAMSFGALLPVFAKDVFHTDAHGYSTLMTCNGVGALGAAVGLVLLGRMRHKGKRVLLGAFLFCLSVIAFSSAPTLFAGCVCLIFAGWFLLTFLMTSNTLVQTSAPDALRGRVFSLYSLALIGTSPVGVVLIGAMAKLWGPRFAVGAGAGLAALITIAVFFRFQRLWKEK